MALKLRAALFDLDGTLVNNMGFHARAWLEITTRLGVPLTREVFDRELAGRRNEEILSALLGRSLSAPELARLEEEKERKYRELYRPYVAPLPGLLAFLQRLRAAGIGCAAATSAPAENRAMIFDRLALAEHFALVVGPEHVDRGKPEPDIYLAAARGIAARPGECLVFEDAPNGVRAARRAGMLATGLTTTSSAEELAAAGAQWTIPDYGRLPPDLEELLFGGA